MIKQIFERLESRLAASLSRVVLRDIKKNGTRFSAQTTGLGEDTLDDVPFFQQYGHASRPIDGTEAIAVNLSGSRENQVIIATDSGEFMLKQLKTGEVALFHPGTKDFFQFKNDGSIALKTKTFALDVENFNLSGDLTLEGKLKASEISSSGDINSAADIKDSAGTLSGLRIEYKAHTHIFTPPAGPNGPPVAPPSP